MRLFESVPNVSEGRKSSVIDRLLAAARSVPEATLIDHSSDPDHNRTVLTLVGELAALRRALLAVYDVALRHIDLREHAGVHPRVGAIDVVPFIPLGGADMLDAVGAAQELGAEVARRHGLPVFLYEAAASVPERRNLAEIRRGGLAGLAGRMVGGWVADFGPSQPHPTAGATVIGARGLLIAFNAVLETDDVRAARHIAQAVRQSSGGLPALKAIGVLLEGRRRAQVSMNLTDFRRTSPSDALAAVRAEAARAGTSVLETELIGLMPEAALEGTNPEDLGIIDFGPERILEHHLRRL